MKLRSRGIGWTHRFDPFVSAIVLAVIQGHGLAAQAGETKPTSSPATSGYVGSSSCRECHAHFYELWAPSHHGQAMQPFTRELSRRHLKEDKAGIRIGVARYRADIESRTVIERRDGADKRYPIEQVMGGKNVFYFLTRLERGRLQVLPIGYDVRRQEWFDVTASAVRHFAEGLDAPLDWRDPALTFNTSCYNCHVSQLSKNYDPASDTYRTSWAEPGINCETCHGPAAQHIAAARSTPAGQPLKDLKLIVTTTFTHEQMNSLCGSCHAKIRPLTPSFPPGERFFDHFDLAGLEDPDFYPDGRDLGETFSYTTWQMSSCVKSGRLDCTHCHTSSGRYRFQDQPNRACLPCHAEMVQHPAEHTHHQPDGKASLCVSCHMPRTEFARMRRTDHSMRPPMPAASTRFGSPNACNLCHADKDPSWADQSVRQWQKRDYQASTLESAGWIAAARRGNWSLLPGIVAYLVKPQREEILSASLLHLLRACDDERKWPAILACLNDNSPLVRAAALDACGEQVRPQELRAVLRATHDSCRLVRTRAAWALAGVPREVVGPGDRAALDAATQELLASFEARPDDAASQYNLGNVRLERQEFSDAALAFRRALQLQPASVPSLVNLSMAQNALGENQQAEVSLVRALQLDRTNAAVNLNLGMLRAEMGKPADAERAFRAAFKSDPQSAAAAYNLGVLLANDRPQEALSWCRRAARLRPKESKYTYTLAFYLAQQGNSKEAVEVLNQSLELTPGQPDSYALLGRIYEQQQDWAKAASLYQRASTDAKLAEEFRQQFARRAAAVAGRTR